MNRAIIVCAVAATTLATGCADMGGFRSGPGYGESAPATETAAARYGSVTRIELIQIDPQYKLGIGTAVGAVAGGLLGSQIGSGRGSTAAAVAGAAVGAAAGTVAESKLQRKDAQSVTVQMRAGGQVTVIQPVDARLTTGMNVRIEGSGETARVVPR